MKRISTFRVILFTLFTFVTSLSFGQNKQTFQSVKGTLVRITPKLADIDPTSMYGKPFIITRDMHGIIGKSDRGEEIVEEQIRRSSRKGASLAMQNPNTIFPNTPIPTLGVNFNGQGWSGFDPSDNNMAVGPNHVIQMVNASSGSFFKIWDKTGATIQNSLLLSSVTGLPGAGDPVVIYDQLSDRWVLTEFGPGGSSQNWLTIAVSTTADPTGTYKIYQYIDNTFFPDYPKYSVWHNAYYATTNDFNTAGTTYLGSSIWAFDRTAMLAGAATATMVRFRQTGAGNPFYNMGTVCLEGTAPSSQNGLFIYPDGSSNLGIFEFTPNFANPPASVVGPVSFLPIAAYSQPPANVAQQGSGVTIGTLGSRMMFRMNFRNRGGVETIVATHTVRGATAALAAVRWYELRRVAGNWTVFQQGTLANPDGNSRWMAGISMDNNGNIGLMYDIAGATSFPSIKYTGRNLTDPLGSMTLTEQTIVNGTAPHTSFNRWGDYNTLVSDPTIAGSYWGTSQYSAQSTRIFNFSLTNGIPTPVITANTSALTAESCSPSNGFIDPNETVTVSLCLQNTGNLNTTNLVATLLPTGGVTAPSGPQTYGAVAFGGPAVCRNFTFTANGTCGGNVVATLQLQDGATNLGTITYNFTLGGVTATFTQNFDAVAVPALPVGWLTSQPINTAGILPWQSSNSGTPTPVAASLPNSIFTNDGTNISDNIIETPSIAIISAAAKVSFSHNFNTEATWDGGVLEISINGGAYQDIIIAGGSFVSGAYTGPLSASMNPLTGRDAWNGSSAGFITTVVNLPAAAAGQNIKLRFRMGSDESVGGQGWRVDNVVVSEPTCCAGCSPVSIPSQPANATACAGGNATFTVTGGGSTPAYQWQVSTTGVGGPYINLSNGAPYSGVLTNTLTITGATLAMNGYFYRAVLTNSCPSTLNSNGASLTVSNASAITSQPSPSAICAGSNTTFTVVASGTPTYQWQVSTTGIGGTYTNLTNNATYSGVTSAILNITGATTAMNGYYYRVAVGSCSSVTSNPALLTVNTGIAITSQPSNVAVCSGATVTFSAAASGSSPAYQWQISTTGAGGPYTDLANGAPYSGVNTATLTITGVTTGMSGYFYRAAVSNSCSAAINSNGASLTVSNAATITSQPSSSTICAGNNTSFSVSATGSSLTYQWQVSTNSGGTWTDLTNTAPYSGVNTTTLTITGATASLNNYQYRLVVGSCSGPINSAAATLTVNTAVAITTQPTASTLCEGGSTTFTSAATGTGLIYQWQVSTTGAGGPFTDIPGANSPTYTINPATVSMNGNYYRVKITGTCTPAGVNSNAVLLTVNSFVTISSQPVPVAVCAGTNISFSVTAAGTGLTYQWQISTNGGTNWTSITGAQANALNLTAVTFAMNGNQYRVVLNGTCTTNLNSNAVTLTVNLPVQINTQPLNVKVCEGSPASFSITTTSFPTGSPVTYQWQESINGGVFINVVGAPYSGATTPTLTLSTTNVSFSGRVYRVIATGQSCGSTTSNTATLTVNALPVPVLTIASYPGITPYVRTGLYVTVSPPGTYTYQWYKNNVLVPTRTASFFDASVDDFGDYNVVVTNPVTGCSNSTNRVTLRDSASNILFIIPNPSSGIFTVSYHTITTGIVRTLNVYDAKGARIYTSAYNISRYYERMDVNLKNAASGVYMVELVDSKGVRIANGKVVIKR
ncbi:MAG: T9SS type A sorting domain-containing protein [Ferruginibacter sp.]